MPTVADILLIKGDVVHAVSPDATVLDGVQKMNQHRIGALVVMEEGFVIGMFTERDVMKVVGEQKNLLETHVASAMSRQVYYARPGMQLEEAGEMMKEKKIRHLPVCDELGRLRGMVSIGDLNAYHVQHQEQTILALNDYIYGRA